MAVKNSIHNLTASSLKFQPERSLGATDFTRQHVETERQPLNAPIEY
jgi:hypothetical protein